MSRMVKLYWTATSESFGMLTGEVECQLSTHGRGRREAISQVKEVLKKEGLGRYWCIVFSKEDGTSAGRYNVRV